MSEELARTLNAHPVIQALLKRRAAGSLPGSRDDGYRIALVIEGGAMRGVISGGMVTALETLGLRDCFDVVIGASAGAAAATYFVAGQSALGTSIYYEDINNRLFIDLRRGLFARPIVDIDFLIDRVMRDVKPLDTGAVLGSSVELRIVATDYDTGRPVVLSSFPDGDTLMNAMRGSAKMPLLAGTRPVETGGHRIVDGGLSDQIPLVTALAEEPFTHILVLPTRPWFAARGYPTFVDRVFIAPLIRWLMSPALERVYLARSANYRDVLDRVQAATKSPSEAPPHIAGIFLPPGSPPISRVEKDAKVLYDGAKRAIETVTRAFEPDVDDKAMPRPVRSKEGGAW